MLVFVFVNFLAFEMVIQVKFVQYSVQYSSQFMGREVKRNTMKNMSYLSVICNGIVSKNFKPGSYLLLMIENLRIVTSASKCSVICILEIKSRKFEGYFSC